MCAPIVRIEKKGAYSVRNIYLDDFGDKLVVSKKPTNEIFFLPNLFLMIN